MNQNLRRDLVERYLGQVVARTGNLNITINLPIEEATDSAETISIP